MSSDNTGRPLEPFTIAVAKPVLDDLMTRLRATRWAPDWNNEDERYGMNTAYLRPLAEYWADGFDWRAAEDELNRFAHHRMEIDGVPIHFLREPGHGPAPIPVLLSHGRPWSFNDWSKVVRPLVDPASFGGDPADAFDLTVVSLPGFGFSTPVRQDDRPEVETPEKRIAFFENGLTRRWYNSVYVAAHEEGGHFGPWENPQSFIDDIRIIFRGLR